MVTRQIDTNVGHIARGAGAAWLRREERVPNEGSAASPERDRGHIAGLPMHRRCAHWFTATGQQNDADKALQ